MLAVRDISVRSLRAAFAALIVLAAVTGCEKHPSNPVSPDEASLSAKSCGECHEENFDAWKDSDHALANRTLDALPDDPAFASAMSSKHGSVTSEFHRDADGTPVIRTLGPEGKMEDFHPDMILARRPLRQYLVPFPGGRWQTTEVAFDSDKHEWFDVYGEEDRRPEEWGFWTNRGMNWNSNCAFCHMTGFQKNYDIATDAYHSEWSELGVSCVQCHGAMPGHTAAYRAGHKDRSRKFTVEQVMENCATCHSRREQMAEGFKPGNRYDDYFRIALPDNPRLYYPDGQIRDEVFVYGSFKMSKMGNAGVTCLNCHDPHTNKPILPVADNTLCMSCHSGGAMNAPVIDPTAHSHHKEGSAGNSCVECHMTYTTYMQRDPRRDHGFTSPDPLLTKELGIPNACNKCHTGESVEWAIQWVGKWYGSDRPARRRTRAVARAQDGDASVAGELVELAREEPIPLWQAALLSLASPWITQDDRIRELARNLLYSKSPVVRAAAVQALGEIPGEHSRLKPLLDDPVRLVRFDAEWALRESLNPRHRAELMQYLEQMADQPTGATRLAQLAFAEGRKEDALKWSGKAIEWDKTSPVHYRNLAMMYNAWGQTEKALQTLSQAEEVAQPEAAIHFMKGLILGEKGNMDEAVDNLREAVRIDPRYARAWYNLGLLYAGRNQLDAAVGALSKAEENDPNTPDYPYALATVYARQGLAGDARKAAQRALAISPGHRQALELLRSIPSNP